MRLHLAKFYSLVACATLISNCCGTLFAATITWTGVVDANWSTATAPTNWTGGLPPANGDSLVFDDTGAQLSNTDDMVGLSVAGLSFSGTTNSYTLNGATPLALTGGATALSNGSSVAQTINLPLSYGATTTLTGGSSASSALAINGQVTNTAASGVVPLALAGIGTITDNFATTNVAAVTNFGGLATSADSWTILDNGTNTAITLTAPMSIIFGGGTLAFGTATSAPNLTVPATVSPPGDHTVGSATATGTFNFVNGTLILKSRLNTLNGNVTVSGGDLQVWNQFQVSNGALANVSTINVTGGLLEVRNSSGSVAGGPLFVASRGMGTLTISAGNIVCSNLDVSRGAAAAVGGVASQGIVNLNGGTITCNTVTTASANTSGTGAGSTAVFNFNGGTLRAKQNQAAFIRNSTGAGTNVPITVIVKSGGAIIDSNAFAVGTAEPLQHDATLGLTPDGGLTVKGTGTPAGTFTTSALNTYTGNTTVQSGTLALSSLTVNNNIAASPKIIVGDTAANSAAGLNVAGITAAGGFQLPSGQTLAGFGTVTGAVASLAGSIVGPGNSIGTLNIATSLALAGNLSIDLNDADPGIVDVLKDVGNLDLSAATSSLTFNITGTPTAAAYVFANYGSLTGTFATASAPAGYTISYSYNDGVSSNNIALVQVPEPTSLLLAATGALGLLALRRRNKTS